jgi:hypothetical protein
MSDGGTRNAYGMLMGKSPEKRHDERLGRQEKNIRMDLREMGCDDEWWMEMRQNRVQWRECY